MESRVGKCVSFLTVFVVLSAWVAATALSQTLSLDDQVAGKIGDVVIFRLSIDYPASRSGTMQAVTINVGFDETILTYDGHARGSLVENWPAFDVNHPEEGQLRIAGLTYTSADGLQPGDSASIVQLRFLVIAMDDATLTISALGDLATFGTRNGQFTFDPQICQPHGDVNEDGSVTAADALLAFQQALSLSQLSACQQSIADVFPQPTTPDGTITASDALCIFQKALGLWSCLDTLSAPNKPPVAHVGAEWTVDAGSNVTLDGSQSLDPDGTIAGYQWTQIGGPPAVTISNADQAFAFFVAPEVDASATLMFRLTVTDDDGATASDEVSVTVQLPAGNQPPSVNAGPDQIVDMGSVVMLMGSGSDSDGEIAGYRWTQTDGPPISLSVADQALASFTAPKVDVEVTLTFWLTVTDDDGVTASGEVSVTVRAPSPFVLDMSKLDDPKFRLQ